MGTYIFVTKCEDFKLTLVVESLVSFVSINICQPLNFTKKNYLRIMLGKKYKFSFDFQKSTPRTIP